MKKRALLWFTQDLRIQDNSMINWAVTNEYEVMALAFEPAHKSSQQKSLYLMAASEIQESFKTKNISFFILKGKAENEIFNWISLNSIDLVLTQGVYNSRDQKILSKIEEHLKPRQIKKFFNRTLLDSDHLPFDLSNLPLVFTDFRKVVEASNAISKPLQTSIEKLNGFSILIPDNAQFLAATAGEHQKITPFDISATESGSWSRLEEYFYNTKSLSEYKTTRNGMLEKNDSSKLSVGLAHGSISARSIYAEVENFEKKIGENESTKWFKFELLWRDYFKFLSLKVGEKLFNVHGMSKKTKTWLKDEAGFRKWCDAQTGSDFVDANMNELNQTGWMSNRGRQNVASFLSKNLQIDWTLGAQYFENHLMDDDPESNWGNWLYVAGVGTDPRDRIFNIQRQAEMYDPHSNYRRKWLSTSSHSNK